VIFEMYYALPIRLLSAKKKKEKKRKCSLQGTPGRIALSSAWLVPIPWKDISSGKEHGFHASFY